MLVNSNHGNAQWNITDFVEKGEIDFCSHKSKFRQCPDNILDNI